MQYADLLKHRHIIFLSTGTCVVNAVLQFIPNLELFGMIFTTFIHLIVLCNGL
eukprot:COSAG01_NODE_61106_length_291_cov_0.760417_1_plen_52_part_01